MEAKQEDPDIVWGLEAIAKDIDRTVRQTHYMLSTGKLPARQIGNRWVASRRKLRNALIGEDAA